MDVLSEPITIIEFEVKQDPDDRECDMNFCHKQAVFRINYSRPCTCNPATSLCTCLKCKEIIVENGLCCTKCHTPVTITSVTPVRA